MKKKVTVLTTKMKRAPKNFMQTDLYTAVEDVIEYKNLMAWVFKNEDAAYRATILFMDAAVPYVQRVV